jgi:hypothetical protein
MDTRTAVAKIDDAAAALTAAKQELEKPQGRHADVVKALLNSCIAQSDAIQSLLKAAAAEAVPITEADLKTLGTGWSFYPTADSVRELIRRMPPR